MNNYQLLNTNILLGGQQEWNICVRGLGDQLYIQDFFLSPISKWISYSRPDKSLLNYTHNDNIKDLYNTIKGDFFELKLDPKLLTKMPIITSDPERVDTYCDMYDMGISRTSAARRGKTLQVFCPLWLEDFGENNVITLRIKMSTKQLSKNGKYEDDVVIEKDLKLDVSNISSQQFHDDFIMYFKNYIKDIVDKDGLIGDKLINIDFNNNYMAIEGINTLTGKKINKNISYMISNLLSRFIPMMDTDSMLITCFKNNNIICKQLFNFNILFNLEDIISPSILNQLIGSELHFEVKCLIDGEELPIKSFSCDYSEDFKIKNIVNQGGTLDFFRDYDSIQLIDKNKISPQIVHWASTIDNDYIFNLYPNATYNTNLWSNDVDIDKTCLYWCNNDLMYNVDASKYDINDLLYFIRYYTPLRNYSRFKKGKTFINNVLYDVNDDIEERYIYINIVDFGDKGCVVSDDNIKQVIENSLYVYKRSDKYYNLIVDSKQYNLLAFSNLHSIINSIDEAIGDENFKLKYFLDNVQESKIIVMQDSITPVCVDTPNGYENKVKEVDYEKTRIPLNYIFRTDGHIKPAFMDLSERKYYMIKKISVDEYNEKWDKLVKTKFPALYKSIGYFFIEEIVKNDYNLETRWFNDSVIYVLRDKLNFTINLEAEEANEVNIKNGIIDKLKSYYINNNAIAEYIYSLYNIHMDFDYSEKDSLENYTYNIELKLK